MLSQCIFMAYHFGFCFSANANIFMTFLISVLLFLLAIDVLLVTYYKYMTG